MLASLDAHLAGVVPDCRLPEQAKTLQLAAKIGCQCTVSSQIRHHWHVMRCCSVIVFGPFAMIELVTLLEVVCEAGTLGPRHLISLWSGCKRVTGCCSMHTNISCIAQVEERRRYSGR